MLRDDGIPGHCLESEVLAALIDDTVSGTLRSQLLAHVVACDGCYTVFIEALRFKRGEAVPSRATAT